jgi:putative phosphoribosyl transferase
MIFGDRREAGRLLAERLRRLKDQDPVVLALPRGGVPVGYEISKALHAPLDFVFVRKIGAPGHEELAVGAVAEGGEAEPVIDQPLVSMLRVSDAEFAKRKAAALEEIDRRVKAYRDGRQPVAVGGRTAIIVDDGIASGATMTAALRSTRRRGPARMVLAVPVAPRAALQRLRQEADEVVCLQAPASFAAVGEFYRRFWQLDDDEVVALVAEANDALRAGHAPATCE